MGFHQLYRIAFTTLGEFVLGPRSPFVGTSGGYALILGLAFEASRLFKIAVSQFGRADRPLSSATG
jgi:hypothetical protein